MIENMLSKWRRFVMIFIHSYLPISTVKSNNWQLKLCNKNLTVTTSVYLCPRPAYSLLNFSGTLTGEAWLRQTNPRLSFQGRLVWNIDMWKSTFCSVLSLVENRWACFSSKSPENIVTVHGSINSIQQDQKTLNKNHQETVPWARSLGWRQDFLVWDPEIVYIKSHKLATQRKESLCRNR